jgi:CD2 antigen cytoplasmic tail-binding protein 2
MDEDVKEEDDDASKDSSSDNESEGDEITKENEKDQTEILKKIIAYLMPGETILKAIKRLGQSSSAKASTVGLSASQRWLKKKNQDTQQASSSAASLSAEEVSALKESLEKLTGFANYFIDRGFYDIYDETYEKIQRKLENLSKSGNGESAAADKKLFDIFADDIDENELDTPKTSTVDQKQDLQGKD